MSGIQPNPEVWPECSECHAAYVLRLAWVFGNDVKHKWFWQQDCKHGRKGTKQPPAVVVNTDGPIETGAQ